jgi:type IV secretion system protein TrbD
MTASQVPAGFEIPVHRALIEPILVGGAPRGVAIMVGTCAAAFGLGLQQWLAGLLIWIAGHTGAVVAARHDADFLPVFLRHVRQNGYWSC